MDPDPDRLDSDSFGSVDPDPDFFFLREFYFSSLNLTVKVCFEINLSILLTWIRTKSETLFIKFCGFGSGYNQSGFTSLQGSIVQEYMEMGGGAGA